ncbi:hypothetical protein J7L05_05150 [bacterium]|nr:hypothetical protein [bacterium]
MRTVVVFLALLTFALVGCSSGSNTPLTPQSNVPAGEMGSVPIIGGSMFSDGGFQATGMLGAYEIIIHPESATADLIAKRTPAIGEDYIVSGISFFTIAPCANCLKIVGIDIDPDGNAILVFSISHPFTPGITSDPPTAANRLDLDVFDLAMVIAPKEATAITYPLTGAGVYSGYCIDPDGYTKELENVISDANALPFFLAIDDSDTDSSTFNKFAMGADATFDVGFDLTVGVLNFDMYLTMGYGFSARRPDRLTPKYYNPEFNRKAAWKVVVTPPEGDDPPEMANTWNDTNNTDLWPVTVEVYDWQVGATVFTGLPEEFGDADDDNVFASSEVTSVSVEIPGMNSTLQSVTTPDSGTGTPIDPLIYTLSIANENILAVGEYPGLVKVTDERAVLAPADGRDFLIDTPDGIELINYEMPEYATYQIFIATVVVGNLMPVADAVATTATDILEGMSVTFDATASADPDGTIDTYEWDFDEDGVFGETPDDDYTGDAWTPTHAFALGDGSIDVQLRVTDNLLGVDELDTPITITVNPSKNIVLRAGVNISDVATIEDTDEVLVMFSDHQVWLYDNGLQSGALHFTMPGTGDTQHIEANSNGDSLCGWSTASSRNTYSYDYSGNQISAHAYTNLVPMELVEPVALYTGSYNNYQADISGFFSFMPNYTWFNRYQPPSYPNGGGSLQGPATGANRLHAAYIKGAHASKTGARVYYLEGDPEWRVERTNHGMSFLGGYWGGTQTDADTGFWDPQDITSDANDDVFVLDILSTGDPLIKKFTNSGGTSLGTFGDSTTISSDPVRFDAAFASNWIYVAHTDMISIFFPSEQ